MSNLSTAAKIVQVPREKPLALSARWDSETRFLTAFGSLRIKPTLKASLILALCKWRTQMADSGTQKVLCETPTPGKQGTRIDRWKYDLVRSALLEVIPADEKGVPFQDLSDLLKDEIPPADQEKLGSLMWYLTCVKLDLEVKEEIERVPGSKPQRIRRCV